MFDQIISVTYRKPSKVESKPKLVKGGSNTPTIVPNKHL